MSELDSRRLVYAINKFLRQQLNDSKLSKELEEGVEISVQCLETAYNMKPSEQNLDVPLGLEEIFRNYLTELSTTENRNSAENFKVEGNNHMDLQNFEDAIVCYTKAIRIDSENPVYYCNRAAALNNLGRHDGAIEDCEMAIKLNPNYGKAFGRLGFAQSKTNKLQASLDSYKRAVELEPNNESHKKNLKLAQEYLANSRANQQSSSGGFNFQQGDLDTVTDLEGMMMDSVPSNNELGELVSLLEQVLRETSSPDIPNHNLRPTD